MKKLVALFLILTLSLSCFACGNSTSDKEESTKKEKEENAKEEKTVMKNDYIDIAGICVNDSYQDEDGSPLKMVYLFYTLNANDSNLEIDSTYTKLTIGGKNTYESAHYPGTCKYASNYYYSSYIEDVYTGTSLKVVATFKIPEGDLAAGKSITLSDSQIPNLEDIRFATDDIQHFNSDEDIVKTFDPEAYDAEMQKREEADAATQQQVKNMINGYYWSFYVNSTAYQFEFIADNNFEIRTAFGTNTGTYTVRKGYIFCTYPSNGYVVEVPYTIENGEIKMDFVSAFDVKSN